MGFNNKSSLLLLYVFPKRNNKEQTKTVKQLGNDWPHYFYNNCGQKQKESKKL